MMAPQVAMQIAVAARLLNSPSVTNLVSDSPDGKAVFAPGQTFANVFDRIVLETPQWLPRAGACGRSGDLIVTLHSWTRGPDCSLTAPALADSATLALSPALTLEGWRVSSWDDEGSNPVGDPTDGIEHVVTRLRYSVQQTG